MASNIQKIKKSQAKQEIDQVINDTIFPDSQVDKPGRSNRHNINSVLVSYAAALQKEATPATIQFNNLPQHTVKRHIRASYDVDNPKTFPTIGNKKEKLPKTQATSTRPPPTLLPPSQMKTPPTFPTSLTTIS